MFNLCEWESVYSPVEERGNGFRRKRTPPATSVAPGCPVELSAASDVATLSLELLPLFPVDAMVRRPLRRELRAGVADCLSFALDDVSPFCGAIVPKVKA